MMMTTMILAEFTSSGSPATDKSQPFPPWRARYWLETFVRKEGAGGGGGGGGGPPPPPVVRMELHNKTVTNFPELAHMYRIYVERDELAFYLAHTIHARA